jgi:hypothetical protein
MTSLQLQVVGMYFLTVYPVRPGGGGGSLSCPKFYDYGLTTTALRVRVVISSRDE